MSKLPRIMRILGWVVFALMWIPFTLIFFNMPSEGSHSFNELPTMMLISAGATFGLMFLAMGLLFGSSIVSWLLKKIAQSRRERMTARIVKMRPTGLTVNRSSDEFQFTLEINNLGEIIHVNTEKLIARYSQRTYQEGMMVNVMYDAATKTVALLD